MGWLGTGARWLWGLRTSHRFPLEGVACQVGSRRRNYGFTPTPSLGALLCKYHVFTVHPVSLPKHTEMCILYFWTN